MAFLRNQEYEQLPQQQYEEEQPQRPDYSQFYNPNPNQGNVILPADVIKYRLESEDIIDNLEHDLKGEAYLAGKWSPFYGREINNLGLADVRSIVSRYCNRGCYLANLTTDQINNKCLPLKKELAKLIFKKYRLFGVDRAKRSLLLRKIIDTVHLSLSRSEDGLESSQITTGTQRTEVIHEDKTQQQPQGGLFRMFKMNALRSRGQNNRY